MKGQNQEWLWLLRDGLSINWGEDYFLGENNQESSFRHTDFEMLIQNEDVTKAVRY